MLRVILHHPDPRLRTTAEPVTVFDQQLATLVDDMLETMYHSEGIGLAATQINVHQQVVVIDVSDSHDQPLVLINPQIEVRDLTHTALYKEGCLSLPSFFEQVSRPTDIHVSYMDVKGNHHSMIPDGLLAVCIQHECDHLKGKLFIDYLSQLKRSRITSSLTKLMLRNKSAAS